MKIKQGVSISGIRPEVVLGLMIANEITPKYGQETVLTSAKDGKHGKNSLHYVGLAVDIRTWTIQDKQKCVTELQNTLGNQFDVILESDHIHIEFQPEEL